MKLLYTNELELREQFGLTAGVDEAGRGPLAGPLVVSACILDLQYSIPDLNDSKKISERIRETIYEQIIDTAIDYQVIIISVDEIDQLNILGATMKGMEEAVKGLRIKPDLVLLDGNRKPTGLPDALPIIKGDSQYASIAAASILAKVTRDRIMREIHNLYPSYNFLKNKGYPTREHCKALVEYGITEHHRRSYKPVKEAEREKVQWKRSKH
ncbi:MAG: ribonuclease HII [Candidatus Cloacimonetes bacterium]|nr:ribonuclease HII [Candidatus Cloacimonadota bacterium]